MASLVATISAQECPPKIKEEEQTEDNSIEDGTKNVASYWNSLYSCVILSVCVLIAAVLTMIPRKNSILYPEYWYEGVVFLILALYVRLSTFHILEFYIFTKLDSLLTLAHFVKVFLIASSSFGVPYCISYVTWTLYMGYNHPLPFIGLFAMLGDLAINNVAFWFLFPMDVRSREDIQRKAKTYLIYRVWIFLQSVPKELMSIVAISQLQWILVLLMPLARIVCNWVAQKIVQKAPETNNEEVKFAVKTIVTTNYISYATGRLSSIDQSTVYGLLIVEMGLHMIACYQIINMKSQVEANTQVIENEILISERKMKVQALVMSEFIEAILPVAYGIAFTMAYCGPNATLMRNIGNNYFGGKVIEDVQHEYIVMLQMLGFDLFTMTISTVSLNYFCNINLFQAFCNMMRKYWMIFLVQIPSIATNFAMKDVNLGLDFSMEHLWITDEGRWNLICNAVEITVEEKLLLLPNSTLCLL